MDIVAASLYLQFTVLAQPNMIVHVFSPPSMAWLYSIVWNEFILMTI